jgi:hypothetical protein
MFSLRSEQVKIAFCDRWGLTVYRVKRLLLAIIAPCFCLLTFVVLGFAPTVSAEEVRIGHLETNDDTGINWLLPQLSEIDFCANAV